MDVQREQPPFSTISGTSMRLSERETIAVYRWDRLSWVAHFRDGQGELNEAATWFKANAGVLRSRWLGSPAALEAVEVLTPSMVAKIAQLHERDAAEQARRDAASAARVAWLRGAWAQVVTALRVRPLRRKSPESAGPRSGSRC
jgi:hypothetical protein